jgi:hypothetical protein
LVNPAAIEIPPIALWVALIPAHRLEERFKGEAPHPLAGDPEVTIASVYAGSRNSYRGSPCGLSPLLVNGKSGISTVFFVFFWVLAGFQWFSTTFAAIFGVSTKPAPPLRPFAVR